MTMQRWLSAVFLLATTHFQAVISTAAAGADRKLRVGPIQQPEDAIQPPDCTGITATPFTKEVLVTADANLLAASDEELAILSDNFVQIFNVEARRTCINDGLNVIESAKATVRSATTFTLVLQGTCEGCVSTELFLPIPVTRRTLSESSVQEETANEEQQKQRDLQVIPRIKDLADGLFDDPCAECVAPNPEQFLRVYNATAQFYILLEGSLPNVKSIVSVEEIPFVASQAPSVSAAPTVTGFTIPPTTSRAPSITPSRAPVVCFNLIQTNNEIFRADYVGDLRRASTNDLDTLSLQFQQIYNGMATSMCVDGGTNTIENVALTIQSPSSAIVNITRTCNGCDVAGTAFTGATQTPNGACPTCNVPTLQQFMMMYSSTLGMLADDAEITAASSVTQILGVVPSTTCPETFTNFTSDTNILTFTGDSSALLADQTAITALEAAFLQSYNRLIGNYCDPDLHTITSVEVVTEGVANVGGTFDLQFVVLGDCVDCASFSDIFAESGSSGRRLDESLCFCPENPVANRMPTALEFVAFFQPAVSALNLNGVTALEGVTLGTGAPSSSPSAAPTELDLETLEVLQGFPYELDLAVFGSTTRAEGGFPIYVVPAGDRPGTGGTVSATRVSDGLGMTIFVEVVLATWEELQGSLGDLPEDLVQVLTEEGLEADMVNATITGDDSGISASFIGLVQSGSDGNQVLAILDPSDDLFSSDPATTRRRLQQYVSPNECPNFATTAERTKGRDCLDVNVVVPDSACITGQTLSYNRQRNTIYQDLQNDLAILVAEVVIIRVRIASVVFTIILFCIRAPDEASCLAPLFAEEMVPITNIVVRRRGITAADIQRVDNRFTALCNTVTSNSVQCFGCNTCQDVGGQQVPCCSDQSCFSGGLFGECANNQCVSAVVPRAVFKWYGDFSTDTASLSVTGPAGATSIVNVDPDNFIHHSSAVAFPIAPDGTYTVSVTGGATIWQLDIYSEVGQTQAEATQGTSLPFTSTFTFTNPSEAPSQPPSVGPSAPSSGPSGSPSDSVMPSGTNSPTGSGGRRELYEASEHTKFDLEPFDEDFTFEGASISDRPLLSHLLRDDPPVEVQETDE